MSLTKHHEVQADSGQRVRHKIMEEEKITEETTEETVTKKKKPFIQKVPFGLFSLMCLGFTYFVGGTIGMLVIPVILCIIFVLPHGVVFAILDIAIRKKKVIPIISLALSLYLIFGFLFIMCAAVFGIFSEVIPQ